MSHFDNNDLERLIKLHCNSKHGGDSNRAAVDSDSLLANGFIESVVEKGTRYLN